jgi:hypothetical protein
MQTKFSLDNLIGRNDLETWAQIKGHTYLLQCRGTATLYSERVTNAEQWKLGQDN